MFDILCDVCDITQEKELAEFYCFLFRLVLKSVAYLHCKAGFGVDLSLIKSFMCPDFTGNRSQCGCNGLEQV